ncbi:diguanylate cyclase [Paenibacillus sambharensis]|uniref:Diguanylate cyclase n=1 Tax=Paenibacillus sambharensis TaxID=1803190 RepID=A0A2W1LML3_9BACL|nr:diguanylate cyclase [Paenibacillus sambharensis]PZD96222.1 diguanylate cyclase [Paenibacillus sambharensis]
MNKYRDMLIAHLIRQLEIWFEESESISAAEVHMLLHTVKGTAGTIGLSDLQEAAELLMEKQKDIEDKWWAPAELRTFMVDFVKIVYNYHNNEELRMDGEDLSSAVIDKLKPLVLILDDDITLLMYLKEQLEQCGWVVVATRSPDKAISYFHNLNPDCFIIDYFLPHTNGLRVMESIQDIIRKQLASTIMISVDNDRETRLNAFRMGADDFLHKPLDMEELIIKLQRKFEKKRWIDQSLFIDELTGAYNRKYLADHYAKLQLEYERSKKVFSLVVIDLDHFKQINDVHGHLMGDYVLSQFAEYMKTNMRPTDVFTRYGGEEFVVLLDQTRGIEAMQVIERLRKGFERLVFTSNSERIPVTFSAGIVEYSGEYAEMKDWLSRADQALYLAKREGRNRAVMADSNSMELPGCVLRVAVIDDDPIVRTMLAESLQSLLGQTKNADIRTYRGGESFFEDAWHTGGESYLIVLDGMLQGMDGLEVLERIRMIDKPSRYLVIMLTARGSEDDIKKALDLGADDYMTKPFSLEELESRLIRLAGQLG